MRTGKAAPTTIDEYLAMLDAPKRAALQKVRAAIHAAAPGAEECVSYGVPAFRRDGRVLMHMGAAAKHVALYPGAKPVRLLAAELAKYDTSKGTIRFAPERPLPAALVRRLVKARLAEYAETAKRAAPRTRGSAAKRGVAGARPAATPGAPRTRSRASRA